MKLNTSEWKPFVTQKLFSDMQSGKANQQMLSEGDDCFYVGAKKEGNGVMGHCARDERLMTRGNCIIFICNGQGSVGFANYMNEDFIGTTDIVVGYNEHLNVETGTFLATIYSQERPKYSFGRKWKTHLKDTVVRLPARHNDDGTLFIDESKKYSEDGYAPDWQFMENYMKSLHHKAITTNNKKQTYQIDTDTWKEFLFGSLISSIHKAKAINKDDIFKPENKDNAIPYITRTESNNGCEQLADINNIGSGYIEEGNAITIGDTTATCFYQKEDFIAGDHIVVVRADGWLNEYTGLYVVTVLQQEKIKYSYGRAFLIDRIQDTVVRLPVDSSGNPDWKFMEDYIKSLPYGDRI